MIQADEWPVWGYTDAWAPEIHRVDNGFIVYFSMKKTEDGKHAVGYARSRNASNPFGPYEISQRPLIQSDTGSIDTTWFKDPL